MTTLTLAKKAVVGRRVELTYHRDLNVPDAPAHPGIVTSVSDDLASLSIRVDGTRYNLHARTDYEGLVYLDEVVPVPALPMGRFTPTTADMFGVWEGVPVSPIGEDAEVLILITDDREKADAAAAAYAHDMGIALDVIDFECMEACWAVFDWEPEDAECPWAVNWRAAEGDDQAVHIFYLPA